LFWVNGWEQGCDRALEILNFGGIGHTMSIHSQDNDVIMKFGLEKPAFRICVNTVSTLGAVGYTTGLAPSMTLGPGTLGGSITTDNIMPYHLMNVKRLAFEIRPFKSSLVHGNTESQAKDTVKKTAEIPSAPVSSSSKNDSLSEKEIDKIVEEFIRSRK
ncbi:MAG TPA: acetaldehyde dehydrogenase, partial [bacterium]|nr:acetaldehyde dehydrogenase [bacterium]